MDVITYIEAKWAEKLKNFRDSGPLAPGTCTGVSIPSAESKERREGKRLKACNGRGGSHTFAMPLVLCSI